MKPTMLAAALLITGLLVPVGIAQAASFDCKKAKSKLEKRVCSDPALGKADEQLAKAYNEALKGFVIPEFIKDSERAWLNSVSGCLSAGTPDDPEGKSCVDIYAARAETLHLYQTAKVYTNYGKKFDHEKVTMLVYKKDNALWMDWYGNWMPDAYKPKAFPEGWLAMESSKMLPKGNKFAIEERTDADISLTDDKITFGGEFGMSVSSRQESIKGDYPRVK